jgi:hypothetical protein
MNPIQMKFSQYKIITSGFGKRALDYNYEAMFLVRRGILNNYNDRTLE